MANADSPQSQRSLRMPYPIAAIQMPFTATAKPELPRPATPYRLSHPCHLFPLSNRLVAMKKQCRVLDINEQDGSSP